MDLLGILRYKSLKLTLHEAKPFFDILHTPFVQLPDFGQILVRVAKILIKVLKKLVDFKEILVDGKGRHVSAETVVLVITSKAEQVISATLGDADVLGPN